MDRFVYEKYPPRHKNRANDTATYLVDDTFFTKDDFVFRSGVVGQNDPGSTFRTRPRFDASTTRWKKYQFDRAFSLTDGNGNHVDVLLYEDLVRYFEPMGFLKDKRELRFSSGYHVFNPPLDLDKWFNYRSYVWIGDGDASVNGDYIVMERRGSRTVLLEHDGTDWNRVEAFISTTPPSSPSAGDFWEDASTPDRLVYRHDGTTWQPVSLRFFEDTPTPSDGSAGDVAYVMRVTGGYGRPNLLMFSEGARRWISIPVLVGPEPDNPVRNMVWEKVDGNARKFFIHDGNSFVPLSWSPYPVTNPFDGEYVYDTRGVDGFNDWIKANEWYHVDDLNPVDRRHVTENDVAARPIIEYHGDIETVSGITKTGRNVYPSFVIYGWDTTQNDFLPSASSNIVFYSTGQIEDPILGMNIDKDSYDQFVFGFDTIVTGGSNGSYGYWRDTETNIVHGIWEKADGRTTFRIDADGNEDVPETFVLNPFHDSPETLSMGSLRTHITSILENQVGFEGVSSGRNNFRYTEKDVFRGKPIIDTDSNFTRLSALFLKLRIDPLSIIRRIAREHIRFFNRFKNGMERYHASGAIGSHTPSDMVDVIITDMYRGRHGVGSYAGSLMGTFSERRIIGNTVVDAGEENVPIPIPASAARIGSVRPYRPSKIRIGDGSWWLRNHDGSMMPAWGDGRDDVWLALQDRFFNAIPPERRTETVTSSSRFHENTHFAVDYVANLTPEPAVDVDEVVQSWPPTTITPSRRYLVIEGASVYDTDPNGNITKVTPLDEGTYIRDASTSNVYYFNGLGVIQVTLNEKAGYWFTFNELKEIVRDDFLSWTARNDIDWTSGGLDHSNPWHVNLEPNGVEHYWEDLYLRLYNSIVPDTHPWEIVGYSIEPDWWSTAYPHDAIDSDGFRRWFDTNPMWNDLINGIVNPFTGRTEPRLAMNAPIPVDGNGNLREPKDIGFPLSSDLDEWKYGKGSPHESAFRKDIVFPFVETLAIFMMHPAVFLDSVWRDSLIDIGEGNTLSIWNPPLVVRHENLRRDNILTESFDGSDSGFESWVHVFFEMTGRATDGLSETFPSIEPCLSWVVNGFVEDRSLVSRLLDGEKIPEQNQYVLYHDSEPFDTISISDVKIVRDRGKYTVFGFDQGRPTFRTDRPATSVSPSLTERREVVSAVADQHVFTVPFDLPLNAADNDIAKVSVLKNGFRVDPNYITVEDKHTVRLDDLVVVNENDRIEIVVLTANADFRDGIGVLHADGITVPYVSRGEGVVELIPYGTSFNDPSDLVSFLFSVARQVERDGMYLPNDIVDRIRSVIRWMHRDNSNEMILSLIGNEFNARREYGYIHGPGDDGTIAGEISGDEGPLRPDDYHLFRNDTGVTLVADVDIRSVRLPISERQHVVSYPPRVKTGRLLFDPLTGTHVGNLFVNCYMTPFWNGRPEANGHIFLADRLVPNIDKAASDITRFNDSITPVADLVKRKASENLYGFNGLGSYLHDRMGELPIFDAILTDERTRFNFHRGSIHDKGTTNPIIAFAKGTDIDENKLSIEEEWAWREYEFGGSDREKLIITVYTGDFAGNFAVLEFNRDNPENVNGIPIPTFDPANPPSRWVKSVHKDADGNYTIRFPASPDGTIDVQKYRFSLSIHDPATGESVSAFHFDPAVSHLLNNPDALAEIDIISSNDPASYTDGPLSGNNKDPWGENEVGTVWWDTSTARYFDYHDLAKPVDRRMNEWGRLLEIRANITRTDDVVTVELIDPYTDQPFAHGLDGVVAIYVTGADQEEYNGEHAATVTGTTTLEYRIKDLPPSPATGTIKVKLGFIDVFEWVESTYPPKSWHRGQQVLTRDDKPKGGTPKDVGSPSYVSKTVTDRDGKRRTKYYYWVKGGQTPPKGKDISTAVLSKILERPEINGRSWFALMTDEDVILKLERKISDGSYLEISYSRKNNPEHAEWILFSKNAFDRIDSKIVDKIRDSLAGVDTNGFPVPYSLLLPYERYGTGKFPPQTVFRDRVAALKRFVERANQLFTMKIMDNRSDITSIFPLVDEGSYWRRTSYRSEDIPLVRDIVADETILTLNDSNGFYSDGDVVKVESSSFIDPWTGDPVARYVRKTSAGFVTIGVDNVTVEILPLDGFSGTEIHRIFDRVMDSLDVEDFNDLIIHLVKTMHDQFDDVDWCIKTSYLSIRIPLNVSDSPVAGRSHADAILGALMKYKPFHEKLRRIVFAYGVEDDVPITVEDSPWFKHGLLFDRHRCPSDPADFGWDVHPWDLVDWDWGIPYTSTTGPLPHVVGEVVADPLLTTYRFTPDGWPFLYDYSVEILENGAVIDPSSIGLNIVTFVDGRDVVVELSFPLNTNYVVRLISSYVYHDGNEPVLPSGLPNSMAPLPTDLLSAWDRLVGGGITPDPAMCSGGAEEAVSTDMIDSMAMIITENPTVGLDGWDIVPWDMSSWDNVITTNVARTFFLLSGNVSKVTGLTVLYELSMDETVYDNAAHMRQPGDVWEVTMGSTVFVEGKNYVVDHNNMLVRFMEAEVQEVVYSGLPIDVSYMVGGIDKVWVNGNLLPPSDYYVDANGFLIFTGTVSSSLDIFTYPKRDIFTGDGATTDFVLTERAEDHGDLIMFIDGNHVSGNDYTYDPATKTLSFMSAPAISSVIEVRYMSENTLPSSSNPSWALESFNGNGTTIYTLTGTVEQPEMVFVDNRFMIPGTDYTLSGSTITFTSPVNVGSVVTVHYPINGNDARSRTNRQQFVSSGSLTEILPFSINSGEELFVFVGDTPYMENLTPNGYTIVSPNTIQWTNIPPSGSLVTVIRVERLYVDTIVSSSPVVQTGDDIWIEPSPFVNDGDVVTLHYDHFPLNSEYGPRITSSPIDYTVVDDKILIDRNSGIVSGQITVEYTRTRTIQGENSLVVRMENTVDRLVNDLDQYDVNGFEVNRPVGLKVYSLADKTMFEWDGTQWNSIGTVGDGEFLLVLVEGKIYLVSGFSVSEIWSSGDPYSRPPVLEYPPFGRGVGHMVVYYGTRPNAAVNYPDAWEIVQHPLPY